MPNNGAGWWRFLGVVVMIFAIASYFLFLEPLQENPKLNFYTKDEIQTYLTICCVVVLFFGLALYRLGDLTAEIKAMKDKQEEEAKKKDQCMSERMCMPHKGCGYCR